jgi:protease-4
MKAYLYWLLRATSLFVLFCFVMPLLFASSFMVASGILQEDFEDVDPSGTQRPVVGVVELTGIIEGSREVVDELYKMARKKEVKAIVLRINSPGGAVGPSQDIHDAVRSIKEMKPVVASMGAVAGSGGLYAALPASKIFAQPGTLTGSIGVVLQLPNFRKITEKVGVDFVTIKSGEFKDVGNTFREMTDKEKDFLQKTVDATFEGFLQAVIDGRKLAREDVLKFADGRLILGSQAKQLGLIDELGDMHQAARAALDLAGVKLEASDMPKFLYPAEKFAGFAKLLESWVGIPGMLSRQPQLQYSM